MGAGLCRCWARGKGVWVEEEASNAGAHGRCLNWMGTQGEGFKTSPQSVRSPEEPAHSLLATAGSWEPHIESLRERRWVVGGGESAAGIPSLWLLLPAHFFEVLPRRAGSIRAPSARLESFPASPRRHAGEDPRGVRPPPVAQENPGSRPDSKRFPETPSPGELRESSRSAAMRPTRLPRGGSETLA